MTVQSYYGANPEATEETVNIRDLASHSAMAGKEHRSLFELPDGAGAEVVALFNQMQTAAKKQVNALGDRLGLDDYQRCGLMLSAAFGVMVDTVDEMRSTYHPTLRAVYMASLIRLMQARALSHTIQRAEANGHESPNDDKTLWSTVDEHPFPMTTLVELAMKETGKKAAPAPVPERPLKDVPEAKQIMDLLDTLTKQVRNPAHRAELEGRLDKVREQFGLEDDTAGDAVASGELVAEDTPEGLRQVAEHISAATGGRISPEQVLESIEQARDNGGMAVLRLPKRRGD